ncbi:MULTISPECIES: hypothetical protein [Bacillus]|uniref:Class I SAM-dependent methyltransferase n=1 Tax=Bacillus paralicheniformis TaxID=1648923 RepID=A0ABY3FRC8_9BACI|nr:MULTISPECIES: hypothetical protein [Bacillus]ETB70553.1 hypothetical protein A943_16910 [Bacillus sp. CPSM8]AJO20214.1 hypothetical protein SC10_B2orf05757 [Bacillus paralicheniformis]MCQ5454255.1 hypothetical protein [Bacillus paralicheniformis]MCR2015470.1 hypothetical protein [Bacillus paralicheniformis]MCY1632597.1 hypothetical protein [Bacillus paralicheniformis]
MKPVFSETAPNVNEKNNEFLGLDDNNPIKWEYTSAVGDHILVAVKSSNLGDAYLTAVGKKVVYLRHDLEEEADMNIETFDTILLGDLLKTVFDSERYIERLAPYLSSKGSFVLWTFIKDLNLNNLLNLVIASFQLGFNVKVYSGNKWIGLKLQRTNDTAVNSLSEIICSMIDTLNLHDRKEVQPYEKQISSLLNEVTVLKKDLVDAYKKEEKLLQQQKKMDKQMKYLERRYQALSSSKLGRLTLFYWKFRKRRGNR